MAYPGYWPGDPGTVESAPAPVLTVPTLLGPERGMRFEQVIWGSTPPSVTTDPAPVGDIVIPDPTRWPGPLPYMGRQWRPNVGGLAGALQVGDRQDWAGASGTLTLSPPNIPWAVKQARSLRAVSQKFNSSAAALAVPGVFVPTSPANAYGQLGSY